MFWIGTWIWIVKKEDWLFEWLIDWLRERDRERKLDAT